ncbi:MAG: M20/M25/M40 family metallo-hydrolase [Chloroflexi bacterium]|nr:M20/M25/M40 family metallo-hydrolase [Chloroflexota bacterium]
MTTDWNAIREESVRLLQGLIRFDTTNPPGNERACVDYIAALLRKEGIESTILESAPGRANLIARLKGNGSQRPFILMGHVDVVPVEAEKWDHPPFGGEIHDGYLYGRGTLDMKGIDAVEIMTFILLKRLNVPLARDVILEINADEEMGGRMGAAWMMEHHRDLIDAEYGITEFGGNTVTIFGKTFVVVQTGEKGGAQFTVRARGTPGHASQPHKDNAVLKLSAALEKLGQAELPIHVTATMRTYIESIARAVGPAGNALLGLLKPETFTATLAALPVSDGQKSILHSQFHNSIAPTILRAGSKINVIPSVAEADIDCRVVPGQHAADVEREVRAVLGDSVELEFHSDRTGIEASPDTPLFALIATTMQRHMPDAVTVPFLVTGGTDARFNAQMGTKLYGFCPGIADADDMGGVHGHNERVSVQKLGFATQVLYEVVSEFCRA